MLHGLWSHVCIGDSMNGERHCLGLIVFSSASQVRRICGKRVSRGSRVVKACSRFHPCFLLIMKANQKIPQDKYNNFWSIWPVIMSDFCHQWTCNGAQTNGSSLLWLSSHPRWQFHCHKIHDPLRLLHNRHQQQTDHTEAQRYIIAYCRVVWLQNFLLGRILPQYWGSPCVTVIYPLIQFCSLRSFYGSLPSIAGYCKSIGLGWVVGGVLGVNGDVFVIGRGLRRCEFGRLGFVIILMLKGQVECRILFLIPWTGQAVCVYVIQMADSWNRC